MYMYRSSVDKHKPSIQIMVINISANVTEEEKENERKAFDYFTTDEIIIQSVIIVLLMFLAVIETSLT